MFVTLMAIAAFAATQAIRRAPAEKSYTITFKDTGTSSDASTTISDIAEMVAEGADYISEVTKAEKVYLGRSGRGLKLGTSKVNGELTLKLAETVKPTKIVVKARKYNDKGENTISINGKQFTLSDGNGEECTVDYDGNTDVSEIAITAPNFRTYVISITVYYNEEEASEPIPVIEGSIVYDFAAAEKAGENPANKNGSAANGQAFYAWENADKTDSKRQDYKGYEWKEGSVLPKECHVWRRSDRINGNVKNGGLDCPSNKEMVIDGLNPGSNIYIYYDATNAAEGSQNIIWAAGTEHGAKATIDGVDAVSGVTTIASGAKIEVKDVVPADNGTGYIAFQVKKGMVIKQIVVVPAPDPIYVIGGNGNWDLTNMTPIAYNQETKAFEFTLDVKGIAFFAISDVKAMAGENDWDGFNDYRWAIAAGDNYATFDKETQLVKTNGTVAVRGYGKYKVSITEDKKMTITLVERYPLYVIGDIAANGWSLKDMSEMTFNTETQSYEYIVKVTNAPVYFAISGIASMEDENDWAGFKANYRYAIGDGGNEAVVGESYKLEKSFADGDNTIYLSNNGLYTISVDKTFKLTVSKHEPEDIVVTPEAGDLAAAIAAAEENKLVKSLTLNLKENAAYTLSAPITTSTDIIINGNGATIDASAVNGALISYQAPAASAPALHRAPETPADGWTYIDNVTIKDITITDIKGSVFYDNNVKLCVENFTIENAVLGLETEAVDNEAIIAFQGGGAKNFTVKNSTVYGNNAVAKYFLRYNNSSTIKAYGYSTNWTDDHTTFTYLNNTFYNLLKSDGQWYNGRGIVNGSIYDVQKNIWYNCGAGDIVNRITTGRYGSGSSGEWKYNSYIDMNDATITQKIDTDTALPYNENFGPLFADPDNGDFTIGAGTPQAKMQTGAPQWLVPYDFAQAPEYTIEIVESDGKGKELDVTVPEYYRAGDVYIALEGGTYTLKTPIKAGGGDYFSPYYDGVIYIGGFDGATLDVSELDGPMIQIEGSVRNAENADGTENANYKYLDYIRIDGLKIKGLKQPLVKDNQKTLVEEIFVYDCVIDVNGNKNIFDFNNAGYPGYLAVYNSTLASENGHTGYFLQSSGCVKDLDSEQETYEQYIDIDGCTLYQIAKGQQMNNLQGKGQKSLGFYLWNSLLFDTGSDSGNEVCGWLGGQNSTNPDISYYNNSYWANNAEATGWYDSKKLGYDQSGTQVYGKPFFRKLTNSESWYTGDFTLGVCAQIGKEVGDPRWYNIAMLTQLQNALAQAASLLFDAQRTWSLIDAENDRIAKLAAAYKDNKPFLIKSKSQEDVNAATARVLAAIAEFLGEDIAGDVTAIESVNAAKTDNAAWYTINGQRVDRPTQKGLYIHNGRKVVIK